MLKQTKTCSKYFPFCRYLFEADVSLKWLLVQRTHPKREFDMNYELKVKRAFNQTHPHRPTVTFCHDEDTCIKFSEKAPSQFPISNFRFIFPSHLRLIF